MRNASKKLYSRPDEPCDETAPLDKSGQSVTGGDAVSKGARPPQLQRPNTRWRDVPFWMRFCSPEVAPERALFLRRRRFFQLVVAMENLGSL
jgi:hypothetical protein